MIERIIIKNFKSIRELDLELKPINILIGANGAGKSNFISFFKLTDQIFENKLQEYVGNSIEKLLYFGRKTSNFIEGLLDFDNKYGFNFKFTPISISNSDYHLKHSFLVNENLEETKNYNLWFSSGGSGENTDALLHIPLEDNKVALAYNKNIKKLFQLRFRIYHFHDTGNDSPIKRMNDLNDNRYLRENGKNLAAFLYYLHEKHPKRFKLIEANVRLVAPFFDRFDLAPDRLNEDQIELRWLEKNSDNFFNAYALSDGTLRFIALTTLLLQPDLPKTVIIDEPELGLHPLAINKLAAMLRQAAAKDSQIIVSTQSSALVDNFEPEDVIAVDRKDEQSVFRRLKSEEYQEWLEDYTLGDLWNKNVIGAMP